MDQIPLNYEASDGDTNKQATSSLPTEVVQCLENARFLHLSTCVDNIPHVSLMNYTYLPAGFSSSTTASSGPVIVMTTNPASKKTHNIVANPNVSLLVHDWVSHRPMTTRRLSQASVGSQEAPDAATPAAAPLANSSSHHPAAASSAAVPSSLASLLLNLNTAAVSSISATINGTARVLSQGSPEETYYRQQHLANNTFDADPVGPDERRIHQQIARAGSGGAPSSDNRFVADEVRVIVVTIRDVRISDWKGQVRDWALVPEAEAQAAQGNETAPQVNGI